MTDANVLTCSASGATVEANMVHLIICEKNHNSAFFASTKVSLSFFSLSRSRLLSFGSLTVLRT